MAATPSVNGSNVFAQPSIIDAQGNTWKIVSGVIEKNGVHVGSNLGIASIFGMGNLLPAVTM